MIFLTCLLASAAHHGRDFTVAVDPDLVLGGFSVSVQQGDDTRLSFFGTVINAGTATAGPFRISIYASSDKIIGEEDRLLKVLSFAGLDLGTLIDLSGELAVTELPDAPEMLNFGILLDSEEAVPEADETNNAAVVRLEAINTVQSSTDNIEPCILITRRADDLAQTTDLVGKGSFGFTIGSVWTQSALADLGRAGLDPGNPVYLDEEEAVRLLTEGSLSAIIVRRDTALSATLSDDLAGFEIPAKPGALRPFDPDITLVEGGAGNDLLSGTAGNDLILGGTGIDTFQIEGDQRSHTLTLTPTSISLQNRAEGTLETLLGVERLDFDREIPLFGGQPMRLDLFDGPTSLTAQEFSDITELYIAYFNRAPDALGLYFWGGEYARGLTLERMAESFFLQPETQGTYANVLNGDGDVEDTGAFVTAVYSNVLGRGPDAAGFEYWVNQLDNNPLITPPNFILSIIGGAKFPAEPTPQTLLDQQYLATKADIGAYFAVIRGMSEVEDAKAVMSLFDGSAASTDAAIDTADTLYREALDPVNGDFLFPLVGVLDDPFALF
ncbi:MAG: DUF4214 domain-containing protein [Sulfitobacter sp.]|nr:DUF4214 domain-containing protein [Sulfitobacter sp.]